MSLARAWTRQLYGASDAALLVPGTIACALAVLEFAGGLARLGSIGQALSGPAAPPAVSAGDAANSSRAAAKLRVAVAAVGASAPGPTAGVVAGGASGRGGGTGGGRGGGSSGAAAVSPVPAAVSPVAPGAVPLPSRRRARRSSMVSLPSARR